MPSSARPAGILDQTALLAADVVDDARTQLMTALRFLDVALWRMPLARRRLARPAGTDGYLFYLDPLRVLGQFQSDGNEVMRDYLHAILHCVFRHPFDERHPDEALWDLSCDIAVESCALELVGLRWPSERDALRQRAVNTLKQACPRLTAAKLYNVLAVALDIAADAPRGSRPSGSAASGQAGASPSLPSTLTPRFVESLPELFVRDDHSVWTREEERFAAQLRLDEDAVLIGAGEEHLRGQRAAELQEEDDAEPSPAVDMPGAPAPSAGGPAAEGQVEGGDRLVSADAFAQGEALFAGMEGVPQADFDGITWTDISHLVSIDMEAFTGKAGIEAGTFEVNLSVANRKVYDYRDFLKRFSSPSEEMKVSTEEFDYVYYTYGLSRYGNMPLVEPLEYQESDRVREFVIAIDTSASCAGGLVRHFVEKTFDVLKSTAAFGRKVNVHVVQCDCEVRKDVKISETADIDDSFAEFTARGFGGTDFRPVFAYVDELVNARELANLKGMIYLTDGIGTYPEEPPDYECAFVFVTDEGQRRQVPPWAMKVLMSGDEILEL